MIMERILTLIRNVLRVPASDYENRTDNDTSIHDEVKLLYICVFIMQH